ncbi:hypothetical protein KDL44_06975 [bacterium]|nr:hypothetical protein [bacterium]
MLTTIVALGLLAGQSLAQTESAAEESSMIPLLKGPFAAGNPYIADYIAVDHWLFAQLAAGLAPRNMQDVRKPGFTGLTVYIDPEGYMIPQLSARRIRHEEMRGGTDTVLDDYVCLHVAEVLPEAIRNELLLAQGLLDGSYHERVPDWLGSDPALDAMLLPEGYVVTRRSRTSEVLEELRAADGSFPEGALKQAIDAWEYSMYGEDGSLLGREHSLPGLYFALAGLELPAGEARMTEQGYFVFLDGDSSLGQVYDYDLQPLATRAMDQSRDSHPFIFIRPEELRMMYAAQQVLEIR